MKRLSLIIKENIKEYLQVIQENEFKFLGRIFKDFYKGEILKIPYEVNELKIVEFRRYFSERPPISF